MQLPALDDLCEPTQGPLPNRDLYLVIRLADGATYLSTVWPVLADLYAHYREHGWYEDADDARERGGRADGSQPSGAELRALLRLNAELDAGALEMHAERLRNHVQHVSGPTSAIPHDLLWAVEEAGGSVEVLARKGARCAGWPLWRTELPV